MTAGYIRDNTLINDAEDEPKTYNTKCSVVPQGSVLGHLFRNIMYDAVCSSCLSLQIRRPSDSWRMLLQYSWKMMWRKSRRQQTKPLQQPDSGFRWWPWTGTTQNWCCSSDKQEDCGDYYPDCWRLWHLTAASAIPGWPDRHRMIITEERESN